MVCELLADNIVELLPGLGGEPHQELVELAGAVHQLGVEEGVRERDPGGRAPRVLHLRHQAATQKLELHNWRG